MAVPAHVAAVAPDDLDFSPGLGARLDVGAPGPPLSDDDDRAEDAHTIKITLQLHARNLPPPPSGPAPSAYAVLYRQTELTTVGGGANGTHETPRWTCVGQTETVNSAPSPSWCTTFSVEFRFGRSAVLRVALYDRLTEDDDVASHRYLGDVRFTLAQLAVLATDMCLVRPIVNRERERPSSAHAAAPGKPELVIRGEEVKGDIGESVTLQFAVSNLRRPKKPFYILSRQNLTDRGFSPICYSEVNQNYSRTHETVFLPITKSLSRLVNNDLDRELKVQVCSYDRNGRHHYGGSTTFRLKDVKATMAAREEPSFALRKTRSSGQIVDAGKLVVKKFDLSVPFSFLDYVNRGVSINTVIAMDMSLTNGHPNDPASLHCNDRSRSNEYVSALQAVLSVLAEYDTKKKFKSYGFGGHLPPNHPDSNHCFPLSGDHTQVECDGIDGVIDTYRDALNKIHPIKPCLYGPMFEHVIEMTRQANAGNVYSPEYTILLMVTDGDFSDFADVANHVCGAADLPLSVVIVGVGNSHFLQLEKLDGDDVPLCSSDGTPCARDLIQFVPFHRHKYNPTQLASEVLDEIPEQMLSYMRSKSIKPSDIVAPEIVPREMQEPRTPTWNVSRRTDRSAEIDSGSPASIAIPGSMAGAGLVPPTTTLSPRVSTGGMGLSNPMPVTSAGPIVGNLQLAYAAATAASAHAPLAQSTVGMEAAQMQPVPQHPYFSSSHHIQNLTLQHGMAMAAVMENEKRQQQFNAAAAAGVPGAHPAATLAGMMPLSGHTSAIAQHQHNPMLGAAPGLGPGPGPGPGAMMGHQQPGPPPPPGMHQAQLFAPQHPVAGAHQQQHQFGVHGMPPLQGQQQAQPPGAAQGVPPHQHSALAAMGPHAAHHSQPAGVGPPLNPPYVMGAHGVGMYNGGIHPGNGDAYGMRYDRRAASY